MPHRKLAWFMVAMYGFVDVFKVRHGQSLRCVPGLVLCVSAVVSAVEFGDQCKFGLSLTYCQNRNSLNL